MATRTRTNRNFRSAGKQTTNKRNTRTTNQRSATTVAAKTYKKWAPGYANFYQQYQQKLQSFKTLYSQTTGAAKFDRPSPTTLKTFTNWINKGANVYTISQTQLNKWAGTARNKYDWTKPTQARNFLNQKFGKGAIKAFARTKNGAYMVACPTTFRGKTFNFPS